MKDDCYAWNCEYRPSKWLRIKWVRSGNTDMIHYCDIHADRIGTKLVELKLADVAEATRSI